MVVYGKLKPTPKSIDMSAKSSRAFLFLIVCALSTTAHAGFLGKVVKEIKRAPENVANAPRRIAEEVDRTRQRVEEEVKRELSDIKTLTE